jgi:hypothetical protein
MQNKSKEQYEEEINDLFSQYSEVSGDDLDTYRKTLLYRLMDTTAKYIFSEHVYIKNKGEYGEEIFITIKNCVGSFTFDKGNDFLHYLKASIKQNLIKSNVQNQYANKLNGLHISLKTINKIKKVADQKQLFTAYRKNVNYEEMVQWIAKNLDFEPKMVKEYLDKQNLLNAQEEYDYRNEADEKTGSALSDFDSSIPEETFFHAESLIETLDVFNTIFTKMQARVKPYLSELLSAKYCEAAVEAQGLKHEYSFFEYEKIALWLRERNVPSQRDIAKSWGRNETDASRTIENFEKRARKKLKKPE